MKVLYLCTESPIPSQGGSPLRTRGWMRTASSFAEVGIITLARTQIEMESIPQLNEVCSYVESVDAPRSWLRKGGDLLLSMTMGVPYLVQSGMESKIKAALERALQIWKPDIVQAEGIGATKYLLISKPTIPSVYSAHNVEHCILKGLAARLMKTYERRVAGEVDCVVTVSSEEARWFQKETKNVWQIPNAVFMDECPFVPPSQKTGWNIVYVGRLDYPPNVEAAKTLALEIIPPIRKEIPQVQCMIVGRNPKKPVFSLEDEAISVLPNAQNISDVWRKANVLVCPLQKGAGSRLKLIESAAHGIPIVATPFSAEGLALEAEKDYLCCKNIQSLAQETIRLLKDPARMDELAIKARQTVERYHNWDHLGSEIKALYENLTHHHRQE